MLRRGANTDSTGVAVISGIPAGAHSVTIRAIGFLRRVEQIQMTDSAGLIGAYALERDTIVLCNVRTLPGKR
jgi:hypothetical protein